MILINKNKMHVHIGEVVKVISGNHRGSQGKIIRVIAEKNQVLIEGVRMITKHLRPSNTKKQGEIVKCEGPVHISNVRLVEKVHVEEKTRSKGSRKPTMPKKNLIKKTNQSIQSS
jgi:large subunit ribosomal protein L24